MDLLKNGYSILNEDCLEGMKRIPSGSVDAIICDPPFGSTTCSFDRRLSLEPMWEQFLRVTKFNAAIVLFSQMPFGAELIMSNRKMFRYEIIYQKHFAVGYLNAKKMPLRSHENILVFYRRLPTYNPQFSKGKPYKQTQRRVGSKNYRARNFVPFVTVNHGVRYPIDVVKYKQPYCYGKGYSLHPQQKPVDLLEYLVKTYTNAGETVLDATMGSGSTGVACINTGRKFIGFETDAGYYDVARRRIEAALATKQQELFNFGDDYGRANDIECFSRTE